MWAPYLPTWAPSWEIPMGKLSPRIPNENTINTMVVHVRERYVRGTPNCFLICSRIKIQPYLIDFRSVSTIWVFPKKKSFPPKWMVKIMVPNPIKQMDDLGGYIHPYFWFNSHIIHFIPQRLTLQLGLAMG